MILHGKDITIPSENAEDEDDEDFNNKTTTRAMRYITKCKNLAWKRWTNEYLRPLRENHQCKGYNQKNIEVEEIFLLKGEEKNRGEWKIGMVTKLVRGEDNIIRGAKLRTGNNQVVERPIQMLYPLKICQDPTEIKEFLNDSKPRENISAEQTQTLKQRPSRMAKSKAEELIKITALDEHFDENL
ncbi:uncharacterized protein LOC136079238 [Hydra vulgaris]|uniref:Uncharacterized protein LOC136079238 n=1 Tax=Hydra vulgaris TaxID=6087 RepID=A0ABM4BPJ7_HYDVU